MSKITTLVLVVIGFTFGWNVAARYLDRPAVLVDMETKECVSAKGPQGKMSCNEAMGKWFKEYVPIDPHKNKRPLKNVI